jgi:hypothetical protein
MKIGRGRTPTTPREATTLAAMGPCSHEEQDGIGVWCYNTDIISMNLASPLNKVISLTKHVLILTLLIINILN